MNYTKKTKMKKITVAAIIKALRERGIVIDDYRTAMGNEWLSACEGDKIAEVSRIVESRYNANIRGAGEKMCETYYEFAYDGVCVRSTPYETTYGMFVDKAWGSIDDTERAELFNDFIDAIVNAFETRDELKAIELSPSEFKRDVVVDDDNVVSVSDVIEFTKENRDLSELEAFYNEKTFGSREAQYAFEEVFRKVRLEAYSPIFNKLAAITNAKRDDKISINGVEYTWYRSYGLFFPKGFLYLPLSELKRNLICNDTDLIAILETVVQYQSTIPDVSEACRMEESDDNDNNDTIDENQADSSIVEPLTMSDLCFRFLPASIEKKIIVDDVLIKKIVELRYMKGDLFNVFDKAEHLLRQKFFKYKETLELLYDYLNETYDMPFPQTRIVGDILVDGYYEQLKTNLGVE